MQEVGFQPGFFVSADNVLAELESLEESAVPKERRDHLASTLFNTVVALGKLAEQEQPGFRLPPD